MCPTIAAFMRLRAGLTKGVETELFLHGIKAKSIGSRAEIAHIAFVLNFKNGLARGDKGRQCAAFVVLKALLAQSPVKA